MSCWEEIQRERVSRAASGCERAYQGGEDTSGKATREMVKKLEGISFRAEANRRRLDMLQQKLKRPE